jgi:hypothetical protein
MNDDPVAHDTVVELKKTRNQVVCQVDTVLVIVDIYNNDALCCRKTGEETIYCIVCAKQQDALPSAPQTAVEIFRVYWQPCNETVAVYTVASGKLYDAVQKVVEHFEGGEPWLSTNTIE